MPIQVMFDKNGFYHDAFGRMGRGKQSGVVYTLPDVFKEQGMLPKTAEIITDPEVLEDILDEVGQKKPIKPVVASEEALTKAKRDRGIKDSKTEDGPSRVRSRRRKVS